MDKDKRRNRSQTKNLLAISYPLNDYRLILGRTAYKYYLITIKIIRNLENFSPIGISMRYNEEQRDKELTYFIKELKRQKEDLLNDLDNRFNFFINQAEYIEELIRRNNLHKNE